MLTNTLPTSACTIVADGANWTAAAPLEGETFNECQVTALLNGSVVLVSRQAQTPRGQPHSYFITTCETAQLMYHDYFGLKASTCNNPVVSTTRLLLRPACGFQTLRTYKAEARFGG